MKKVVKLTEKDLNRIVKRTIKEQQMDLEVMDNLRYRPITLDSIKSDIKTLFQEFPSYVEDLDLRMVDIVIDELAKHILEDFHYNLDYMSEQYEGLINDVIDKYSRQTYIR